MLGFDGASNHPREGAPPTGLIERRSRNTEKNVMTTRLLPLALGTTATLFIVAQVPATAATVSVVAEGLSNPRGLAFAPDDLAPPVRVITGFPSMAPLAGGLTSSGPVDVEFFGMQAYVLLGCGGAPTLRDGVGAKSNLFGNVVRALPNRSYQRVADLAASEIDSFDATSLAQGKVIRVSFD
jgi:hypothetical protein